MHAMLQAGRSLLSSGDVHAGSVNACHAHERDRAVSRANTLSCKCGMLQEFLSDPCCVLVCCSAAVFMEAEELLEVPVLGGLVKVGEAGQGFKLWLCSCWGGSVAVRSRL